MPPPNINTITASPLPVGGLSQGDTFEVAASVQVKNERTGQACYVSSFEFLEQHSIFKDEASLFLCSLDS